jgi:hypothetical protein
MNILKERLMEAIETKNATNNTMEDDITTYVWKGPKEMLNGQKFQDKIKLIDAADEQLIAFYDHCKSMLYSKDVLNPGRYVLIEKIQEDREKCNAELYIRYLEGIYKPEDNRSKKLRRFYLDDLNKYLSTHADQIPPERYKDVYISDIMDDVPMEFSRLTVDLVRNAAKSDLGTINRKPITLNFLVKLGVWFDQDEIKDLNEIDENTGKRRDRIDVVKERLGLKPTVRLKSNDRGLSYRELRSMVKLKNAKFENMTTEQLYVYREKVSYRLEDSCLAQAKMWEEKMAEIEKVAKSRGWSFEEE